MDTYDKKKLLKINLNKYLYKKQWENKPYFELNPIDTDTYVNNVKLFKKAFKSGNKNILDALWNSINTYVEIENYNKKDFSDKEYEFIVRRINAEKTSSKNIGICYESNANDIFFSERLRLEPSKLDQKKVERLHHKYFKEDGDFELYASKIACPRNIKKISLRANHMFMLYLKETDELIGHVGIDNISSLKVGPITYYIFKKYRNKGYAKEALSKLIELAFNKKLKLYEETVREDYYKIKIADCEMLIAYTDVNNHSSQKLLESCGFEKTGIFHRSDKLRNKYIDLYRYELMKK